MVKRGHSRASLGSMRQDGQVRSRSHYSRPAGLPACPDNWLPLKHVRRWSKSREWVGNLYTAASPSAAVGQARSGQMQEHHIFHGSTILYKTSLSYLLSITMIYLCHFYFLRYSFTGHVLKTITSKQTAKETNAPDPRKLGLPKLL